MSRATVFSPPSSVDELAITPVENPLYWFNGLPTTCEGVQAVGLHLPCGDPTLDGLAELLGWQSYLVIHSGGQKPYWSLPQCSLIFIAQNLQTSQEFRSNSRKGLVYAWGPLWDRQTGTWKCNEQGKIATVCQVKARIFLRELVDLGYIEPFQLALRGRITDSFLQVCRSAYRLTRALTQLRKQEQRHDWVYLYSVSVPLRAASLPVAVSKDSHIYPMQSALPVVLKPEVVRELETPLSVIDLIQDGLLAQAITWSTLESAAIKAGKKPEGTLEGVPAGERTTTASSLVPIHPIPPAVRDPLAEVDEQEEEHAMDLLFGDASPEQHGTDERQQRLTSLKEAFRTLLPKLSRGTPNWWECVLLQVFKERWLEESQVCDQELSEADLDLLEHTLVTTQRNLAAKRAAQETGTTSL